MQCHVEPCRLGHAVYVARRLSAETQAKAERFGVDPRRVLADSWRSASECWTLRIDGKIAAIGGWHGAFLGNIAEVWLAVLPLGLRYWRVLLRATLIARNRLLGMGKKIVAHVLVDEPRSIRFAEFCGLHAEGDVVNGAQKMVSG